jgi:integral membrane protein (TIGR01906 family)
VATDARWSVGAAVGGAIVAFATAIVILGVAVVPLFSSAWIHFEQDRASAAALTSYTVTDLHAATDSIVHDLLLGGDFDVAVAGATVLDPSEQAHMRDVRVVFAQLGLVVLVAAAILLGAAAWARSGGRTPVAKARLWQAVRRGAGALAVLLVVLGVVAVVAFDAAFEVFHRLLFPGGNYTFDPRTEKLVQLFPIQFWSDTALAWGGLALALALLVAWTAGRRAGA